MKNIALFASGTGSNAKTIIEYFVSNKTAKVCCLLSDNPKAKALEMANSYGIDTHFMNKEERQNPAQIVDYLKSKSVDIVVLAGYLKKIPALMIEAFPNSILNIHPALLPKFGGKGMYGMHVHRAVVEAGESSSGMTIHYVNAAYDEGAIIFQASCALDGQESPEEVAAKVLKLEHQHYAPIIEKILIEASE